MNIIYILLPLALLMSFGFVFAFVRTVREGQYDDLDSPPYKMLLDDVLERKNK